MLDVLEELSDVEGRPGRVHLVFAGFKGQRIMCSPYELIYLSYFFCISYIGSVRLILKTKRNKEEYIIWIFIDSNNHYQYSIQYALIVLPVVLPVV